MPLNIEDLEILRRDLAELPPARPQVVSTQAAVLELAKELNGAMRRGYTVEELVGVLAGRGLAITVGTLRGYLRQAKKKTGRKTAGRAAPKMSSSSERDTGAADAISANAPEQPRSERPPAPGAAGKGAGKNGSNAASV